MVLTLQPETAPAAPLALELDALLHRVACAPLPDTGWIRVTGADRVRWLNGMVTNSIPDLAPGHSNYNFFLNAQGRIQGDACALMLESSILLGTDRTRVPALTELLDRFIIMDDVELSEHPSFGLLVQGPEAASTLTGLGLPAGDLGPSQFTATNDWRGHKIVVLHAWSPLVPRFELWTAAPEIVAQVLEALTHAGATTASPAALEALRILSGTPRYGTDIRNTDSARDLPQETNQTRALHFSKGCYLGQEIVERIRARGNVHRTFSGFQLTGALPAPGAILSADGKPVGELTSVAAIPLHPPVQLALGYLRREALAPASAVPLTYPGGTALPLALPVALPFPNA